MSRVIVSIRVPFAQMCSWGFAERLDFVYGHLHRAAGTDPGYVCVTGNTEAIAP